MKILGIHDGHNASACLLEDGKIKYCIQEERLTNKKNFWGFPGGSIEKVLEVAKIQPEEINFIAFSSNHVPQSSNILEIYKKQASHIRSSLNEWGMKTPLYSVYKAKCKRERMKKIKQMGFSKSEIVFIDHHLCHASAAYYASPWKSEDVLVLTNDGSGDGLCSSVYIGKNGILNRIAETPKGNSIGDIYSNVTFMLGLVPWEDEWKIMGMAPYASQERTESSYNIFKRYLSINEGSLTFTRNIPEPTYLIYKRLKKDLEFQRFDRISAGIQKLTEELLCQWVKNAIEKTDIHKIALSGGVFMNVKANKKISEIDIVEDIFITPSCGDESNSIGAAFQTYACMRKKENKDPDITPLGPIYLGTSSSDSEVKRILSRKVFKYEYVDDIEKKTAELLAEGKIIARCKGKMEFGARALGNRSILADPSNTDCVRVINMMIKKRDFWMPFAPVILRERQHEYIINPKNMDSPYMMLSFDTTDKRGDFMAGVHPADLTARAQILEEKYNPDYYRILKEFEKITNRGVLLNTSFNLHGYPMVYGHEEALWVFENSGLEYLALENYLIRK